MKKGKSEGRTGAARNCSSQTCQGQLKSDTVAVFVVLPREWD